MLNIPEKTQDHRRRRASRVPRARGIDYERAPASASRPDAPADELLAAYAAEIDELKARGGYVTADVIDVSPETPGLDAMLKKFNPEHWHDEDEIRLIVEGRGVFHIHPPDGRCSRSKSKPET